MSKYTLPGDEGLKALIRDALEQAPGPDMRRLQQLEDRLARASLRQTPARRPNTLPWWAVLLLAGGFAAAAWWAGDVYRQASVRTDPDIPPAETVSTAQPSGETSAESATAEQAGEAGDRQESPIIYQREP